MDRNKFQTGQSIVSYGQVRWNGTLFNLKCTKVFVDYGHLISTLPTSRTYRIKAWMQIQQITAWPMDRNKFQPGRSIVLYGQVRWNGTLFNLECTKVLVDYGRLISTQPTSRTYRTKAWMQVCQTTAQPTDRNKFQTVRSIVSYVSLRCNRTLFNLKCTKVLFDYDLLIYTLSTPRIYRAKASIQICQKTVYPMDRNRVQTGRSIV